VENSIVFWSMILFSIRKGKNLYHGSLWGFGQWAGRKELGRNEFLNGSGGGSNLVKNLTLIRFNNNYNQEKIMGPAIQAWIKKAYVNLNRQTGHKGSTNQMWSSAFIKQTSEKVNIRFGDKIHPDSFPHFICTLAHLQICKLWSY
jgi:hypothetical protein